ncbi:hypothetical protein AZE42_12560 [Rhizopogon vesiculosus]|uniref:Uncharacterized protein n=1 Tax=Rhizopogon vesiculosus TaxID=180088 RepID=A0A1J8QV15_9AGAM|nr:hypothetical protein AZE42_12560 [Rhizopogon vesiculosus]
MKKKKRQRCRLASSVTYTPLAVSLCRS